MNHYKNLSMKDHIKDLSFFISPGLDYLGINYLFLYESKIAK